MDQKSFDVEYTAGGISDSKAASVERLIPTFKKIATAFSIDIAVDCYDGSFVEIQNDIVGSRKIYFHIDASPPKLYRSDIVAAPSIFGLVPAQPIPVQTYAQNRKDRPNQLPITELHCPEMYPIGHILGSHILIHPDILTSGAWSEENRIKLLRAIAYWFVPRAIINALPDHGVKIASGLNGLRLDYSFLHPSDELRKDFQKRFKFFISSLNSKTLHTLKDNISKSEQKIERLTEEYFGNLARNVTNKKRLELIKSELSTRNFANEFEALLNIESIETIRIQDGRYIVIKTCPIFQIPAIDHEHKVAEAYDIGEFIIKIDINSLPLTRTSISFFQDGYTGPYRHGHILTPQSAVCFGTDSTAGLNSFIDNLISKFDVVPLIHLIITFLKKEKSKPAFRDRDRRSGSDTAKRDEYKNDEERGEEKKNFIKLVSDTVMKSSVTHLEKTISDLNLKINANHSEILTLRESLHYDESSLSRLNKSLANEHDTNKEANYLMDDESIFDLILSDEGLLIYFHCRKPAALETEYSSDDYILKLTDESVPRLLILSPRRSFQLIHLINPHKPENSDLITGDEVMVSNLQNGHIWEILKTTKEKITGGTFDQKLKTPKTKEKKNGR